jgi:hypothetical protein
MVEFFVAHSFGQQKCLKKSKQALIRERKAYVNYIKEKKIQGKQKQITYFPIQKMLNLDAQLTIQIGQQIGNSKKQTRTNKNQRKAKSARHKVDITSMGHSLHYDLNEHCPACKCPVVHLQDI